MRPTSAPAREALAAFRLALVAALLAGGALVATGFAIALAWDRMVAGCLGLIACYAIAMVSYGEWAFTRQLEQLQPGPASLPAESFDPRFPITATDPALAAELLLASLTTHPPRPARGPAT